MLFQDGPANTVKFMAAGYSVGIIVMTVYITSLVVRWKNLKREIESLEELDKETK